MKTLLLPATSFHWALFTAPPRSSHDRLQFLAEEMLPRPIEDYQCHFEALPDNRFLVVAMPHEHLSALAADSWRIAPQDLPEELAEIPKQILDRVNLLQGTHEPRLRRTLRRTVIGTSLAASIATSALIFAIACQSRASDLKQAAEINRRADELAQAVAPAGEGASALQPPALRLMQEWRRLTAAASGTESNEANVTGLAEALWQVWPDKRIQTEQIRITPTVIEIRALCAKPQDAQEMTQALGQLRWKGQTWQASPLSVQQSEGGARFTINLTPPKEGGRP